MGISERPVGYHVDYIVCDDINQESEVMMGNERKQVQMATLAQAMAGYGAPIFKSGAEVGGVGSPQAGSLLHALKHFDNRDIGKTVESLMELAAFGRSLQAEFEANEIPAPKWLSENLRAVRSRVKAAYRALQEEKLRLLDKEIEELRSKEEKKQAKEKEREELKKALGVDE